MAVPIVGVRGLKH